MKINKLIFLLSLISFSLQQCANYSSSGPSCTCQTGYYSTDPTSIACQKCPINTTTQQGQTIGDISKCNICDSGFYAVSEASPGSPITCAACPNNSQSNSRSGVIDQGICDYCQYSYYLQTPSALKQGSQPGVAAACIKCPNNTTVSTTSNKPQSESDCSVCQQGFYLTSLASNGKPPSCSACPEGKRATASSQQIQTQDSCSFCSSGYYYTEQSGQPTCTVCPNNTTNGGGKDGINSCNFCKPNHYKVKASTVNDSAYCEPCPQGSGYYYMLQAELGNKQVCNICIQGYYMNQAAANLAAATCVQCPANSTSKGTGVVNSISSCTCFDSLATTLSDSQQTCQCKSGYGGNVASSSDQPSGCSPCGSGQYSNNLGKCVPCPAGTFSSGNSNSSCEKCPPGQYTSGEGSTSQNDCKVQNPSNTQQTFSRILSLSLIYLILLI